MSIMSVYTFEHLNRTVYTALYTSVAEPATLRKRIIAAATATGSEGDTERDAVNFAFIDASLVRVSTKSTLNLELSV